MLSNKGIIKVPDLGLLTGFPIMLKKELGFWWGKSKIGIAISIASLLIINGIVAFSVWLPKEAIPEMGSSVLISTMDFLLPLATIIIMLGSIIGENKLGTSEWVLSKPITRESFLLSKIVGNWIGLFVSIVVVQTVVALLQTLIATGHLPNMIYLSKGIGLLGFKLLFFVVLMIFLGIIAKSRSVILGALLFLAIIQLILAHYANKIAEWLPAIFPSKLGTVIQSLALGQTVPFEYWYLPIISVGFLIVLLGYLSAILFNRKEF